MSQLYGSPKGRGIDLPAAGCPWIKDTTRQFLPITSTAFGTITDYNVWYKRDGNDLLVRGQWFNGIVTAAAGKVQLPSWAKIDMTLVPYEQQNIADNLAFPVGVWRTTESSGVGKVIVAGAGGYTGLLCVDYTDKTTVYFSYFTISATYEQDLASNFCNNGQAINIEFRVPIEAFAL